MKNEIEHLFDKVTIIVESKNERELSAQERGENFNVFELLGLQTDETRLHSTLLAELLSPNGTHGLGAEPLKLFIANFCQNRLSGFDTNDVIVEKEKYIGKIDKEYNSGGRIDILVRDTLHNAIIIENKIYACDQYKQLYRYRNFAKDRKFKDFIIFYLNLFGNPASFGSEGDQEIDKVSSGEDYLTLSYKDDIIPWLKQCRALAVDKPYVREVLGLYIDTLNAITDNNMNNTEKEELFKFMDAHIQASAEIITAGNDFSSYLIREHIIPKLLEWADKYHLKCNDTESFATGKIYSGISFSKPEWSRSLRLEFEKDNFRDLIYGIVGNKDQAVPDKIDFAGLKKPNAIWHYGWSNVSHYGYINSTIFVQVKNGDVAKEYVDVFEKLYEAIIENDIEM